MAAVVANVEVAAAAGGTTQAPAFVASDQALALHVVALSHPGTFVVLEEAFAPAGSAWVSPETAEPVSPEANSYFGGFAAQALSPNKVVARHRCGGAAAQHARARHSAVRASGSSCPTW